MLFCGEIIRPRPVLRQNTVGDIVSRDGFEAPRVAIRGIMTRMTAFHLVYALMPDPVHAIDVEVGNWFTSTHPRSPFVLNLTAQRIVDDTRHILSIEMASGRSLLGAWPSLVA